MSAVEVADLEVVVGGGENVLPPTTFSVESGSSLAVTGPSGSGKSTLLECLTGWRSPTRGTVRVNEDEVSAWDARRRHRWRRDVVGVVHQDAYLLTELDIGDNVSLLSRIRGDDNDLPSRVDAVLRDVGLEGRERESVATLSGGEAQRVALARALISARHILVADEPTAALDRSRADDIARLLVSAAHERRVPLVVATHDPLVADLCDSTIDLVSR